MPEIADRRQGGPAPEQNEYLRVYEGKDITITYDDQKLVRSTP